jgi:FlaA1/EpsC-like NDP-sugar epimerase
MWHALYDIIPRRGIRKLGHNRYFLAADAILLALAIYASFVLRLESLDIGRYQGAAVGFIGLVVPLVIGLGYATGVYNRYWHYASFNEIVLLVRSTALALAVAFFLVFVIVTLADVTMTVPRSIPFIFAPLAFIAVIAPRFAVRAIAQYTRLERKSSHTAASAAPDEPPEAPLPTLVIGAGTAGSLVVREIQQHTQSSIRIVGFIDDDTAKHGLQIHGMTVLGSCRDIPQIARDSGAKQVIIAMPEAPGPTIRDIVTICKAAELQAKVIPALHELISGRVQLSQIRDVQISDLLQRDPVQTDMDAIGSLIQGKRVLITGGGGSIGSELCRQVLRFHPSELLIVGRGENSIFQIHNELRCRSIEMFHEDGYNSTPTILRPIIADIRFANRMQAVFEHYQPQIVFHAAAHKHVPLMEYNPTEAIVNNILGTSNVLRASRAVDVERFVMISTDKAVNPTSIMGASKRACEYLVQQAAYETGKHYVAVRFGNVLGSRGSVVLTFKKQIARGGPVTVTHPDIERYFMTIPEAVQLVLQAAVLGKGGEVFALDMGQRVKIADLARDLIRLSGLEVGRDIEIVYTGMRPGEKLYEELFTEVEVCTRTIHDKIFIATDLQHQLPFNLNHAIDLLVIRAEANDAVGIRQILQELIPQHKLTEVAPDGPAKGADEAAPVEPLKVRAVGSWTDPAIA